MTTTATQHQGQATAELLFRAVQIKWFGVAPARVHLWLPALAQSYTAYLDGHPERLINLPDGATGANGITSDEALNILEAFNDYLGRDVVWEAYRMATSEAAL